LFQSRVEISRASYRLQAQYKASREINLPTEKAADFKTQDIVASSINGNDKISQQKTVFL